MTRCPKCGAEMGEGTAYCANPSCGAVSGRARPARLDFVTLARFAALLIAVLAFTYLYFGAKVHK